MPRFLPGALIMIGLLCAGFSAPVEAASKYNACGLLTAAELQAVAGRGVDNTQDRDVVIPSGPYKDETMSTRTWALGTTYATLNVIREPRTPSRSRRASLAFGASRPASFRRAGPSSPERSRVPTENAYKPPASEATLGLSPRASW